MKRIYLYLIILTAALAFNACAESEYADFYKKPSETPEASCEKLMTGVFYAGRAYTFNAYWRIWTWDNRSLGKYAQTIGITMSNGSTYDVADRYARDRWEDFYNTLTQFRTLEHEYEKLDEQRKPVYRIFKNLAEVFIYDHLSQVVDIWGDVPFSKAGYLNITDDLAGSYAPYEKATQLYTLMLNRLGELSADIKLLAGNLDPQSKAFLPKQDFINKGDLDKWLRYTNSLRLRLAVRVASQGELSELGKKVVKEILDGGLPLVSSSEWSIQLPADNRDTSRFFNPDDLRTGYVEGSTYSNASQAMLNALMQTVPGTNDPRLPVLYSKNAAGQYKGLDPKNETIAEQESNKNEPPERRVYSRIDSTTVGYNTNFISPILTAAEVDFLKAEAYQQAWASGNAEQAFINGVTHSAEFVFHQNAISPSTFGTSLAYPGDAVIQAYAKAAWDANTNKLESIITQKWLNFGYFQSSQAWNEVRRTGYPNLFFPEDEGALVLKKAPKRVKYPNVERSDNNTNWNAQVQSMGGDDDYYIPLFWAKP